MILKSISADYLARKGGTDEHRGLAAAVGAFQVRAIVAVVSPASQPVLQAAWKL